MVIFNAARAPRTSLRSTATSGRRRRPCMGGHRRLTRPGLPPSHPAHRRQPERGSSATAPRYACNVREYRETSVAKVPRLRAGVELGPSLAVRINLRKFKENLSCSPIESLSHSSLSCCTPAATVLLVLESCCSYSHCPFIIHV